jgi:galacturan 1,4-alpha-galacturonidase
MKFFQTLCVSVLSVTAFALPEPVSQIQPIDSLERREPGGSHGGRPRHVVTIRSSEDDTDDISAEFLNGIKKANHGGTLYLKKGKKYVIGKKLDLSFLNDVHVQLDGEIKVCTNQPYDA